MTDSGRGRRAVRAALCASVAAATIVLVAACGGAGASSTPPASTPAATPSPSASPLLASAVGTWGDATDSTAPSISLAADGTLTGTDGCNRLVGRWEEEGGGRVEFDDVASTRMACAGVDTWLSALDEAVIDGDTMAVLADDGLEIGSLERTAAPSAPPAAAAAFIATWGVDELRQPHLTITADGLVSGSDGCNSLGTTWEFDDDGRIEFGDVSSTDMACSGIDQSLNRLDSASVDGDTLTVYDDHDVVLATLPRSA